MADTVTTQSSTLATIPASTVIETDQLVSGAHVQKIKLMDGTADSTEVIQGSAANGLEVDVTRVSGSVAVTGTFWQATQPVSIAATVAVDSELTTADLDTGGGTDTRAVVGLVTAASGGGTLVSAAAPLPVTVISGGGGTQYAEDAAHSSGDSGSLFLAKRTDTPAVSSGTDGDYSTVNVDKDGKVWTNPGTVRANRLHLAGTLTATTSETTALTAVASTFLDVYGITLTNTSNTATKVSVRDATSGTVRQVLYVPAGSTVGWMTDVNSPMSQTTSNNNWTLQCGTSVSSIEWTIFYVKNT